MRIEFTQNAQHLARMHRINVHRQWQFGDRRRLPTVVAILVLLALLAVAPTRAAPQRVAIGTYFGGSSADTVLAVASDSSGIYLTGQTYSSNLPGTTGALNGSNDMFVAKLTSDGTRLLWTVRLGGSKGEAGRAIISDGQGAVYITGNTNSPDFPTTAGVEQRTFGGYEDIVLLRLDAATGATRWSTYFGQDSLDEGNSIALDGAGNVLVAGWWAQHDAVVIKFDAASGIGMWGTAWSGRDEAKANALALAPDGTIWVTGTNDAPGSESAFEIVGPALQSSCGVGDEFGSCGPDAFVTRLSADGQTILYSSLLGGSFSGSAVSSGSDEGHAIAVDAQGNVLVAGTTFAADFPTKGAFQATKAGAGNFSDGFLTKLSPDGSTILYSTFLGGMYADQARRLMIDGQGQTIVAGFTDSNDFPTQNAIQPAIGNGFCDVGGIERSCNDVFVTSVSPTGALLMSTYLGGSNDDYGYGLAPDSRGGLLVAGTTESHADEGFPITPEAFQAKKGFDDKGFVIGLGTGSTPPPSSPPPSSPPPPPPGPYRVYMPQLQR